MKKGPQLCVIVFPLRSDAYECGQLFVTKFIQILSPLSSMITLITGNYHSNDIPVNVFIKNIYSPEVKSFHESVASKIYRLILAQITISVALIQMRKEIDILLLFFSHGFLFIPSFLGWVLKKKIIVVTTGSFSKSTESLYSFPWGRIFYLAVRSIEKLNYSLANIITVDSDKMINELDLHKYINKISTNSPSNFLDIEKFKIKQSFSKRKNVIGYVGRLSAEKGVMELSEAIPLIISRGDQIEFLIVGDGPLRTSMEEIIEKNKCMDMVTFAGWVPYESIPDFLNKMRFHILPSHTEAIGSSNIEAIACGVIPIINNVGALPGYVVIDKSTGFVLENNLPETIANKFDQIWMYSETDLEAIQKRGINLMLDNYTYDRVSEKWQKVIKETFEMRRG